jgi:riboflavin biosynthesis pyrimidine reductase
MTIAVRGPGAPYTLLFDDDTTEGVGLPESFRAVYGGDWRIPAPTDVPYTYINFVISRDGRISFDEPGHEGGGDISRRARHDVWLMALARARADAIIVGASTLRVSLKHRWFPEAVFRDDCEAYAALRAHEGRAERPTLVLVTRSGEMPADAVVLKQPRQPVVIATTERGAGRARALLPDSDQIVYHISPGDDVDLPELQRWLRAERGVASLLSEGGAALYGALIAAGAIHDELLTVSPIVVGNTRPPARPRTSLVEGVAFDPASPPEVELLSVRRYGSYLFQRSRYKRRGP